MVQLSSLAICWMLTTLAVMVRTHPVTLLDLTYEFSRKTPRYPTHTKFESTNLVKVFPNDDKSISFMVQDFVASEHAGTHMDSPFHYDETSSLTIEQMPIEYFTGEAVVINISNRARTNPDAVVTIEDLQLWEEQHGRIPEGSIILMNSGWNRYWEDMTQYLGTDTMDPKNLHYPGFSEEACQWLCQNRFIHGIGVDTAALDPGNSIKFPCHHILSKYKYIILENVANMHQMPPAGAIVRAYPMKIRGGTGAPTRIIATLQNLSEARSNAKQYVNDEL